MPSVQQLENYAMHPFQWARMVPTELLDQYAVPGQVVSFGMAPGVGWFVLHKDESTGEKSVLHLQNPDGDFTPALPDARDGIKYGERIPNPKKRKRLKVGENQYVYSTAAIVSLLGIPLGILKDAKIGERHSGTWRNREIVFKRLDTTLYEIISSRPVENNTA